jgi:hypothetical protein
MSFCYISIELPPILIFMWMIININWEHDTHNVLSIILVNYLFISDEKMYLPFSCHGEMREESLIGYPIYHSLI